MEVILRFVWPLRGSFLHSPFPSVLHFFSGLFGLTQFFFQSYFSRPCPRIVFVKPPLFYFLYLFLFSCCSGLYFCVPSHFSRLFVGRSRVLFFLSFNNVPSFSSFNAVFLVLFLLFFFLFFSTTCVCIAKKNNYLINVSKMKRKFTKL